MTKIIPLTRGARAVVDDEDCGLASSHKWHLTNGGYAARRLYSPTRRNGPMIFLHREVARPGDGLFVDHINGDRLDNRRDNLRICTHAENLANLRLSKRNTSGFKGVSWDRSRGLWAAHIAPNGRSIALGRFSTAEEAARAYDSAAASHFGAFARLNFPAPAPAE